MKAFATAQNHSSSSQFSAHHGGRNRRERGEKVSIYSLALCTATRHASCFDEPADETAVNLPGPSVILALNETRKTLLASRLHLAYGPHEAYRAAASQMLPGDGVWVEACNRIDTSKLNAALDLLFLDSAHQVIAAVSDVRPGGQAPEVDGAVGVLKLPAGTIGLSQTKAGDKVVLDPIRPFGDDRDASRAPRS